MAAVAYPSSLPGPTAAPFQPAERRLLSTLPGGPRQTRPMQRDRKAAQQLDFIFTHAELAIFEAWLDGDLVRAGAWFASSWPQPQGDVGVRRFVAEPSYPIYYPNVGWHVSANVEVRGLGMLPQDDRDLYWDDVILHLNAETSVIYDSSSLHRTLTASSTPALETIAPLQGGASLNLSAGSVVGSTDGFYAYQLSTNEWTLRGWFKALALPLNANNRFFYFSGLIGAIPADGRMAMSSQIAGNAYALGAPAGSVTVGTKQFFALTRTNNGAHSKLELFLSPDGTSDAVLVGTSLEFGEAFAQDPAGDLGQLAGYFSGSLIHEDDFQLTKNINRYRGLTSFPVPTGPLTTR